jgi:hypothetical protein
MSSIHGVIAWAIPVGFGVVMLWSLYCFLRNRPPVPAYWNLLGVLQVLLAVQLVVGVILIALGGRPPWLHYAYGAFFPAALLVAAHRLGQRFEDIPWVWFGIASALICGLTIRAFITGQGG